MRLLGGGNDTSLVKGLALGFKVGICHPWSGRVTASLPLSRGTDSIGVGGGARARALEPERPKFKFCLCHVQSSVVNQHGLGKTSLRELRFLVSKTEPFVRMHGQGYEVSREPLPALAMWQQPLVPLQVIPLTIMKRLPHKMTFIFTRWLTPWMSDFESSPKGPSTLTLRVLLLFLNPFVSSIVKTAPEGGEFQQRGPPPSPDLISHFHDMEGLRNKFAFHTIEGHLPYSPPLSSGFPFLSTTTKSTHDVKKQCREKPPNCQNRISPFSFIKHTFKYITETPLGKRRM